MLVPIEKGVESLEFFHDQVEVYPVWLCPFRLPNNPGMLNTRTGKEEMYLDIGVYGTPLKPYETVKTCRNIEAFVSKVSGCVGATNFPIYHVQSLQRSLISGSKCYTPTHT